MVISRYKWSSRNVPPPNTDLNVSQTKELFTDTGNGDQVFLATPLDLFCNLAGPMPITSCVKTYETYVMELWWLLLLADYVRRQNIRVNKCDRFRLLSGTRTCQESFLDSCNTLHDVNLFIKKSRFLRFKCFCHISSLRDVTVTREI